MDKLRRKKLVNYILICVFALLWIAAMLQYIKTARNSSVQSMAGVIEAEELSDKCFVVRCRGKLGGDYYTEEEKTAWLLNAAAALDIPTDGSVTSGRNDNIVSVEYIRQGANARADFQFLTRETEVSPEEIVLADYMDLQLDINGALESAFFYREKFKELCGDIVNDCEITIEFSGKMKGCLEEKEMRSFSEKLLAKLSAKEVCSEYNDSDFDVYAYSDTEDEYILVNDRKVNVNIVMTCDENNRTTTVYVSVPVINSSY